MWIPLFRSHGLSSKSNLSVWPKHTHRHCSVFWEERGKGETREGVEDIRRWQEIKTEDSCKHFLEIRFLIPLIHRHPSFPQQHLWALVPTENWSCACHWACEPCQILIEYFKPWGEVYLVINLSNSDHSSTLSTVENVLEPTGKQTYTVHPLHRHPHFWQYGMHYCFRNHLIPGAIF